MDEETFRTRLANVEAEITAIRARERAAVVAGDWVAVGAANAKINTLKHQVVDLKSALGETICRSCHSPHEEYGSGRVNDYGVCGYCYDDMGDYGAEETDGDFTADDY